MRQPKLTAIVQSRRLTLFWHIAYMDDNADAKRILSTLPPEDFCYPTISHCLTKWIWPRTGLCGGCGRRTALRNLEPLLFTKQIVRTIVVNSSVNCMPETTMTNGRTGIVSMALSQKIAVNTTPTAPRPVLCRMPFSSQPSQLIQAWDCCRVLLVLALTYTSRHTMHAWCKFWDPAYIFGTVEDIHFICGTYIEHTSDRITN